MWFFLPASAFLFAAAINIFVARKSLFAMSSLMSFFLIGSIVGVTLVVGASIYLDVWLEVVAAVSLYGLVCVLYMLALALVMASVSVFILLLIKESPRSAADIHAHYSRQKMLATRFSRVESAKLIEKHGDEYVITNRGRIVLETLIAIRRLFGHEINANP